MEEEEQEQEAGPCAGVSVVALEPLVASPVWAAVWSSEMRADATAVGAGPRSTASQLGHDGTATTTVGQSRTS